MLPSSPIGDGQILVLIGSIVVERLIELIDAFHTPQFNSTQLIGMPTNSDKSSEADAAGRKSLQKGLSRPFQSARQCATVLVRPRSSVG